MTALFAGLGALVGAVFAVLDSKLQRSEQAVSHLEREVIRDVPTLIELGESEHVEFKATARWDASRGRVNKALSEVVVKTIAAFANSEGGSLLVGVGDDGEVLGLAEDYRTLKSPGRDGFEQLVVGLVRKSLGGEVCRYVRVLFAEVADQDVCRVVVQPAGEPVFMTGHGGARFVVRAGNASHELDARETVRYVAGHWGSRLPHGHAIQN